MVQHRPIGKCDGPQYREKLIPLCFSFTLTLQPYSHHFWHQMCKVPPSPPWSNSLPHQLGALQINSILTLSTWIYCQIPQVKSSVPQDCPQPTCANHNSRLYLCFWLISYKSEVPASLSLDLINFPEELTELRKIVTYVYQFILKIW